MNNSHDLLADVKGDIVKDYVPKYKTIELIEVKETYPFAKPIGLFPFKKVKKEYGDRKIHSVMDFNDTRTTSIIIEMRKNNAKEGKTDE